jgi:hypothetical protein
MKQQKDNFDRVSHKPIKLDSKKDFKQQLKKYPNAKNLTIIDQYLIQLEEVFLLRNPKYRFDKDYRGDFVSLPKHMVVKMGFIILVRGFIFRG